jgi:hypothetical protein
MTNGFGGSRKNPATWAGISQESYRSVPPRCKVTVSTSVAMIYEPRSYSDLELIDFP